MNDADSVLPNANRMEEDGYLPPKNKRKALAERKKIQSVLSDWYSDGDALASAMMKYLPKVKTIGEVISVVLAKKLPQYALKLTEIQKNWEKIAGAATAKRSYPLKLYNSTLVVEVSHPAYVRILDSQKVKSQLLGNIRSFAGADCCTEIKFVPIGRRCIAK